ncbi:DUF7546 family protein [Natronomonas sp.]|uniref:DUF7546 family protein n=1 Tax=Natronomonas sp. TaxID=2184060 RepID=UPI00260870F2|nr:hypothetical protein [Natronomonas sp.]
MMPVRNAVGTLEDSTRRTAVYTAVTANTLVLAVLLYSYVSGRTPTAYWFFPIVWITVGVWALVRTTPDPADSRTTYAAAAIGAGYFLVLAAVGGIVTPASGPAVGLTVQFTELPPGWNPAVLYDGSLVQFAVVPYSTFGYFVLAYLVYATAIEARGAVAGGLLGLFSCVSCTVPVIASAFGSVVGGAAVTTAVQTQTYGLGTAVFVVTVLLLLYRPGLERLRRLRRLRS